MLVLMTLAAMLMAFLRALEVAAGPFLSILAFVAAVLWGQVVLFRGRKPLTASAWVGALLLPGEVMVADAIHYPFVHHDVSAILPLVVEDLVGCICWVPSGMGLGAVAGMLAGGAYAVSDDLAGDCLTARPKSVCRT